MGSATKGSENFIVTEVLIAIGISIAFIIVTLILAKGFAEDWIGPFVANDHFKFPVPASNA